MDERSLQRCKGQALVETGIIIVGFFAIILGVMTFGHALAVANMISHATRDGAHIASTWSDRGTCGGLANTATLQTQVQQEIAAVVGQAAASSFAVNVGQSPTPPNAAPCNRPATPLVTVNVTGCVPFLFPIIPLSLGANCSGSPGFSVNTTIVSIDEGV